MYKKIKKSTTITNLMSPPHHEVGENSNPHNRAQEGEHKKFSGFLLVEDTNVRGKLQKKNKIKTQLHHEMSNLVPNIWNCEPQRENYGQQEEVGDLFAWRVRPL